MKNSMNYIKEIFKPVFIIIANQMNLTVNYFINWIQYIIKINLFGINLFGYN